MLQMRATAVCMLFDVTNLFAICTCHMHCIVPPRQQTVCNHSSYSGKSLAIHYTQYCC